MLLNLLGQQLFRDLESLVKEWAWTVRSITGIIDPFARPVSLRWTTMSTHSKL
jgi:hypothetical protein